MLVLIMRVEGHEERVESSGGTSGTGNDGGGGQERSYKVTEFKSLFSSHIWHRTFMPLRSRIAHRDTTNREHSFPGSESYRLERQ